jgi:hypothetical protein
MISGMTEMTRVTVTLARSQLEEVARREPNRSRFIQEAVRRELARRARLDLEESLAHPHAESRELEPQGLDEWPLGGAESDVEGILDEHTGTAVSWTEGAGWRPR